MAVRLLATDVTDADASSVHKSDGTKDEYVTWAALIAAETITDIEVWNRQTGEQGLGANDSIGATVVVGNGVAPLTALPTQGATTRAAGQGCANCAYAAGCLALVGKRTGLSARNGTRCGSYLAAS